MATHHAEGYGRLVGRKTTFRLVNSQHVGFHEANETVIQQMQSEVGVQLFLKARADHPERKYVLSHHLAVSGKV